MEALDLEAELQVRDDLRGYLADRDQTSPSCLLFRVREVIFGEVEAIR